MRIGIIGSGQIGGTLTRRFRAVGHEVAVTNSRGPANLAGLAQETGASVSAVSRDAVARDKDLVVVAVPMNRIPTLPRGLFSDALPINQIGFDAVDAGPKAESWRQQPGSPVSIKDLDSAGVRRALAEAVSGRGPA